VINYLTRSHQPLPTNVANLKVITTSKHSNAYAYSYEGLFWWTTGLTLFCD